MQLPDEKEEVLAKRAEVCLIWINIQLTVEYLTDHREGGSHGEC